jgi:hypothetical protein
MLELVQQVVMFTSGVKVWDINWEYLSGKSIYRTDGWDNTLFFYSDKHTYKELEQYWDKIGDMFIGGKDWEDFDTSEESDGSQYTFHLDGVTVVLRIG